MPSTQVLDTLDRYGNADRGVAIIVCAVMTCKGVPSLGRLSYSSSDQGKEGARDDVVPVPDSIFPLK